MSANPHNHYFMKRFFFSFLLFTCASVLCAVPADRQRLKVRLTDGTELYVMTCGDEHYSWLQADDGTLVEPDAVRPGFFVRSCQTKEEAASEAISRRQAAQRIGSQATAPLPATGSPKVPVVLVNFQDSTFSVGNTPEEVNRYYDLYCNGTRDGVYYKGHKSYGSIRDYFEAQSDGQLKPEFVVIGPVQLDNPVAAYGKNSGSTHDSGYSRFQREVISKATKLYEGKWSDFDNRGKGQVDMVFFIFAGCGENTVQINPDLIWPKEVKNTVNVTTDDGETIRFATSGCCPENRPLWNSDRTQVASVAPDGIGVMCHELSHALGLPDFYDTNYRAFGMDVWSLMDYGCYMQNGYTPVAYTAYEREFMGWRQMEEIKAPGSYTLSPIASDEGVGMKVVNPENENEYYVLEARLASGWDSKLANYGRGLQVTHVDYNANAWNSNSVNVNTSHQRMTIIAANNNYNGTTTNENPRIAWKGNLYPFEQNDSLTATSVPAATVFSASGFMPHSLTNIRIDDATNQIHFDFDGADVDGIDHLITQPGVEPEELYDLSGRSVQSLKQKGLYITRGRKIILGK